MSARCPSAFAVLAALVFSSSACAAWQVVATDQGKRVEIDRDSIASTAGGGTTAKGRIVLDRPIADAKTAAEYRIIEVDSRFNCTERTVATLKRSYFKEEGDLLRQEDVRAPFDIPVRSGSPDDKLFREACRPTAGSTAPVSAAKTVEQANEAAGELRKANEAMIAKAVEQDQKKTSAHKPLPVAAKADLHAAAKPEAKAHAPVEPAVHEAPAEPKPAAAVVRRRVAHPPAVKAHAVEAHAAIHWSYEGEGGPDNWGKLDSAYATCASGMRQSPIDIRDGIRVDLEPIQFAYRPSRFRVVDNGHSIQVSLFGGGFSLLGKNYQLVQFHFHQPSEELVNGRPFDMVAHMVHKSDDGKLAVVAVLLEQGSENPAIQTVWNNLPLEKNEEVVPPALTLDAGLLLPEQRAYYTYMGSLTTPPCTENVLWLVLKQPQQISAEQLAIFKRLYTDNVRPTQPGFGRIIKESR